jgi:hypothetical protein
MQTVNIEWWHCTVSLMRALSTAAADSAQSPLNWPPTWTWHLSAQAWALPARSGLHLSGGAPRCARSELWASRMA